MTGRPVDVHDGTLADACPYSEWLTVDEVALLQHWCSLAYAAGYDWPTVEQANRDALTVAAMLARHAYRHTTDAATAVGDARRAACELYGVADDDSAERQLWRLVASTDWTHVRRCAQLVEEQPAAHEEQR